MGPSEIRYGRLGSGFDHIGDNRTFQVHLVKLVGAYFIDLAAVFAPLWSFLYMQGIRAPWVYGIFGGIILFVYSTFLEAIFRTTIGKFIVGLEVRSVRGPMTSLNAVVRNILKLFWFAFPLLDTLAGLVVDGDPRRRWSDNVLGTTVAQSHLIHVREHSFDAPSAGGR